MKGGAPAATLVTGPDLAGIPYRYVALGLVCLGIFLGTIDTSVVNIALPTLADEFDTSTDRVLWVVLAFILVSTGLSLTLGRIGDVYGRKRIYVGGFALFTAASGLAAISGSLPELLGARVVQGIGASMLFANGAAIITATFPAQQRGQALGIMVATVGAGVATGPILGGVLVDVLDWRAIFWTRLPFGVIGSFLVWRYLIDTAPEKRPQGLDLPGAFVLFGMLFSLVLAVNRGDAWGWSSGTIIALFVVGAALVALFIWLERRTPSPVVALDLFRIRAFSGAIISAVLQFIGLATVIVLMPFFLVEARGFSTLEAGAIMAAFPLAILVVSPIAGWLADRMDPRYLTTIGLMTVTGALLFMATISVGTPVAGIVARLIVMGVGSAVFSSPNTLSIMGSVPTERLGTASASQTTARTMGQAIGIAVAGALFTAQAASYALARSDLGLDDPLVRPEALRSGMQLAMVVAAGISAAGILTSWTRGRAPTAAGPALAESAATDRRTD